MSGLQTNADAPYLLAIDVGTQSSRAIAFDLEGNIVSKAQVHIEPYVSPQPGWAEQDPEVYWSAIKQACHDLWQAGDVRPEQIAGMALTTQRATVVCVDESGSPLRPAIVWLDQRRTEGLPPVGGLMGLAFKLAGVSDTVAHFQAEAEVNWLKANQPEILEKTHKYLLLSGYLTHRLVGQYVDSVGCQVGYIPFEFKRLKWAKARDWKWDTLALKPSQLPELIEPGHPLGALTKLAAADLGLPNKLPVIAAAADKACEVLGSGCVTPDIACLSFGTTATINTTTSKYLEVVKYVPPYPAAVPGHYSTEIQIYRGFWMVSWFKKQFAHRERMMAEEQGLAAEDLFDELVSSVPAGSMGLMLQPFWSPGVRDPGPEAKGAIIGFGDVHTRAHVYQAILEGLAYGLRDGMEKIQKRSGQKITSVRVAGGGSQSDAAMQITADIFGLTAVRPHIYETSALGAAINTAVGLGKLPDYPTAVQRMTRIGDVFDPNPVNSALYDELYERVYQRMYTQLKPLYQEIRAITGYPPS